MVKWERTFVWPDEVSFLGRKTKVRIFEILGLDLPDERALRRYKVRLEDGQAISEVQTGNTYKLTKT